MPTFDDIFARYPWRPIPECPGRYVISATDAAPAALVGQPVSAERFVVPGVRDAVLVVAFDAGGGLISYAHVDGRYVHTLNTPDGFRRKLAELGVTAGRLQM